jgi:primosomal protein N' (replication factor Y)
LPAVERSGRYRLLPLQHRIAGATLPRVRLFDMGSLPRGTGRAPPALAPPVLEALRDCSARGEQSLVFLNRRGYAPVLHCADCGWKSECPNCSAWRVFHKLDRTLRCHHCGHTERVPRACPTCGNLDLQPLGRGTEKLAEQLAAEFRPPASRGSTPMPPAGLARWSTRWAPYMPVKWTFWSARRW